MRNKGFIIIETFVALAVLSIGITALVLSLRTIAQTNRRVRNHAMAGLHAENIINRLAAGEKFNFQESVVLADNQFTATLLPDTNFFSSGLKKYELTVFWRESQKEYRSVYAFVLPVAADQYATP